MKKRVITCLWVASLDQQTICILFSPHTFPGLGVSLGPVVCLFCCVAITQSLQYPMKTVELGVWGNTQKSSV